MNAPTRTSRARGGFCLSVTGTVLLMAAASAPSPFYPQLIQDLQLPPVAATVIFAIYAIPLLIALLVLGSASDRFGRRRVLIVGALLLAASLLLFWAADSFTKLLTARALQGLAAGLLIPALNAMMVDFEPAGRPGAAALANTAAPMAGLGIGAISAAGLLDLQGIDAGTVFLVLAALFVLIAGTAGTIPEPHHAPLRDERPTLARRKRLPASTRRVLVSVVPAVIAGWVTNGMFLALGPVIISTQFAAHTHVEEALSILVLAAAGVAAALLLHRSRPRRISLFGTVSLGLGALFSVLALSVHSFPGYLASVAIVGAGFGTAFMGAMRTLLPHVDPEQRARVMAVIYTISYLAMSVPTVLAGLLVPLLTLPGAAIALGAVVVLLSITATVARLRLTDRAGAASTSVSPQQKGTVRT
ncbi:MFS transporter [Microbacterium sp. SY138]|uniref:MFS transporter n=1 Tax=unclassified Microbacterium TaxID=2609290 RepID=UPI00321C01AC